MGKSCNVENMKLFVDALFTGEYEQTKGGLRSKHPEKVGQFQYCCLGVATDLAVKCGVPETFPVEDTDEDPEPVGYNVWESGYLSKPVMEWLGIDSNNPILDFRRDTKMRAGSANDEYGQKFPTIGDAFRRTYLTGDDE